MINLKINRQGWLSKLGDLLMLPIMYSLQFPSLESPQRTHFWNNRKLAIIEIEHLDSDLFVTVSGDDDAVSRWFGILPMFHMPIFGGWKKYVVLEPEIAQDIWFIGWLPNDLAGISRISLSGKVRVLRNPNQVNFFGINENGDQIKLVLAGEGVVGKASEYRKIPLL